MSEYIQKKTKRLLAPKKRQKMKLRATHNSSPNKTADSKGKKKSDGILHFLLATRETKPNPPEIDDQNARIVVGGYLCNAETHAGSFFSNSSNLSECTLSKDMA